MTPHNHPTVVPGCFRCELAVDEAYDTQTPEPACPTCEGYGEVILDLGIDEHGQPRKVGPCPDCCEATS